MSGSNYGTVSAARDAVVNGVQEASEEGSLLGKSPSTTWSKRLRKHMTVNVSKNRADLILLAGYIITGLLDSSSISIWSAFVSMQTGNTVYLGLGLSNPGGSTKWIKSLISIASFCFGSLIFMAFHRHFSPRRRWVLTASYLIQLICIIAAALIVTVGPDAPTDDHHLHWKIAVPLAALAFQSSGQAITSRVLQYGGLTSVVLTSNYCDLFSDPNLLAAPSANIERNRRVAAPILLLGGAVAGGFFAHSHIGLAGALWTAVALKAIILFTWIVWRAEGEED